jgi:hypothetical protein
MDPDPVSQKTCGCGGSGSGFGSGSATLQKVNKKEGFVPQFKQREEKPFYFVITHLLFHQKKRIVQAGEPKEYTFT